MNARSAAILLASVAAAPLAAQTTTGPAAPETVSPPAPAAEETGGIGDIVVTAQLRRERLQEVPLAVTALSGATLQRENIESFSDLARLTPGFTSNSNYGFIRNSSMRGISNNQFGFADDPSIAIFTDGIYQGRGGTGSQVNAFYDVDRVEVIKGPQATLFGRSSIGGAINTILNQPVAGQTSLEATLGTGDRQRVLARGAVNLPLGDELTLRVAGDYERLNGYLRNLNGGDNLGPLKVAAGRATVRYTGIAGLDVTLRVDGEDRRQSGAVYQQAGLPKFTVDSTLRGRDAYSNFSIFDAVLRAAYTFSPGVVLTSTTSFRSVKNRYVEDYDAVAAVVGGPYAQQSRDRLFQQDLILNIDSGRLSAVAGASLFRETLAGGVNNWVDAGFAFTGSPTPGLLPNDYSGAFNEAGTLSGRFHGWSAFADLTYEIVDKLKLTGGVRYNYDYKRYSQNIVDPATLPINAGKPFAGAYYNWGYFTSTPVTSAKSWDDVSFRAALNYQPTPDLNLYGSYNQGWKAGGIDSFKLQFPAGVAFPLFFGLDAVPFGGVPNVYNPEQSDSYEVGAKGRFFDRKLALNLALYSYNYRDLQVSVPQGGSSIIANVGRAVGRGVEAEVRLVPVEWLDLFGNFSYNYTKIRSFPQKPEQVGQPLNQAPKWTAAGGGTVTAPLPGGAKLSGNVTVSYRDRYRNDNALVLGVPSYTLTNARLTFSDASGRLELSVFADNLFNVATYGRYNAATPFLFAVPSYSVLGEPRTVGVDLTIKLKR